MADKYFERDLPIKPFVKADMTHSTVRITLDYDKSVKGPVVTLQAAEVDKSGPFEILRMAIFSSPSVRVVMERGWKMNNKKRMEAAAAQLEAELAGKRGDTWAALEKMLAENGSELQPVKPAEEVVAA